MGEETLEKIMKSGVLAATSSRLRVMHHTLLRMVIYIVVASSRAIGQDYVCVGGVTIGWHWNMQISRPGCFKHLDIWIRVVLPSGVGTLVSTWDLAISL